MNRSVVFLVTLKPMLRVFWRPLSISCCTFHEGMVPDSARMLVSSARRETAAVDELREVVSEGLPSRLSHPSRNRCTSPSSCRRRGAG